MENTMYKLIDDSYFYLLIMKVTSVQSVYSQPPAELKLYSGPISLLSLSEELTAIVYTGPS